MKKTWIKIKRGLLKPKHRKQMGVKIWVYMHMLDIVDWETGIIDGWKDKDEAEDFGIPWRTMQKQRQELEGDGYITCIRRQYSLDIVIHKWVNPREYGGDEYNTENESTQERVLSGDNGNESTPESTHQIHSKVGIPSYSSQITNHIDKEEVLKIGGAGFYILNLVGLDYDDADKKLRAEISQMITKYGEYVLCDLAFQVHADYPELGLGVLSKIEDYSLYYTPEKPKEGELDY